MAINTKAYIELDRIQKKVELGFIVPKEDMINIGTEMADKIRVRTRIGQDVTGNKLKPLSASYIAYRNRNKSDLFSETTAKKSNLTYTGQLLNSMKVSSNKTGQFIIDFKNDRAPIKTKKGSRKSTVTNSDIVYYQKEKGRDFFGFSEAEKKYLVKRIIIYFKERFAL